MWLLISLLVAFLVSSSKSLYAPGGDVAELVPSNFDRLVLQSDSIWIVEFFAPWCGHCQQLVPDYQKAAKALKGIVKFGAVNADEHRSLGAQYGIQGFPTIKIFTGNKNSPIDFNGQRTAQGIAEAAIQEIRKKVKVSLSGSGDSGGEDEVIQLTDSNFDKLVLGSDDVWLVEFFAPWCGHCKNLAPHWAAAASELKGKVKLGALDATVNTAKAQEYEVKGYPTIKFFHAGKKSRSDAVDYDGGRTSSDIIAWALEKHSDSIAAPEIKEITDESVLKTVCQVKPLCVVAILPHILDCDSKCRNSYLDILKEMAEKYKRKEWGWIWAEGAAQNHLEESLELGGFGYPAMAVANLKKMKFSVLKGSFSRDGINEFLRDISYGRGQTAPVKGASLPKIYKTEPWDGKDGQLPELDDVDLSDIDLDEKDEL